MKLQTERLSLQKYRVLDIDAFCDVICNDEVMLHISGKGNSIKVANEKFEAILKSNKENDNYGVYKVVMKESKNVIGFAKIVPYEKECIEIGYALLPKYWRKGYTIEMIKKMISHCLDYFPDKKLMAIVNQENKGSINVIEKCGFEEYKQEEFKGDTCLFYEY